MEKPRRTQTSVPKILAATISVLLALASWRGGQTSAESTPAALQAPAGRTRVIMLGTGTPIADPAHSGPATAIVVDGEVYLVDCGPGIVRRASAAGLALPSLRRVFITHLHSDHTLGYPDLIFSPWVEGRREPLEAFGPPGLQKMTEHVQAAWTEDVAIRIHGLERGNTTGHRVRVTEIAKPLAPSDAAVVVYQDVRVTVKAFAVPHGSWKYAYGYRFETPDRVIVISGDTTYFPEMVEHARGADLLIHEVYCEAGRMTRPPPRQEYHRTFHTSAGDVGRIAAAAKPKLLVLYHVLLWGQPESKLLEEIRAAYSGPVVIAKDLEVF